MAYASHPSKRKRTNLPPRGGRTTNRVRPRTYKKKVAVKPKRAVRINKSRIDALEQKINGHVQRGYHRIKLIGSPGGWNWAPGYPILFALNDFYTQTTATAGSGNVYSAQYSGAAPNIVTQAGVLDRWQDYLPGETLGLAPEFRQWKDQKVSQPSKVGYQPLYTEIRVGVNRTQCDPTQGDMWVRIDIFTPRKLYLATSGGADPKNFNMPNALGSLSSLAVTGYDKNAMNPALWKHIQKTRWIKLPAVDQRSNNVQTNFVLRCGFPRKFLSVNLDVDATTGAGEPFWQSVDPRAIHWCLISLSHGSVNQTSNPTPEITMTRKTVWRDSRGAQM